MAEAADATYKHEVTKASSEAAATEATPAENTVAATAAEVCV